MINIYTTKQVNGLTYINDVEAYFFVNWKEVINSKYAKNVIKKIDGVTKFYDNLVETPFGIAKYTELSTGCKALLIALYNNEFLVNFLETGENVVEELILLNKQNKDIDVNIFTPKTLIVSNLKEKVYLNGKLVTWFDISQL